MAQRSFVVSVQGVHTIAAIVATRDEADDNFLHGTDSMRRADRMIHVFTDLMVTASNHLPYGFVGTADLLQPRQSATTTSFPRAIHPFHARRSGSCQWRHA
jgi:hypothetical protein